MGKIRTTTWPLDPHTAAKHEILRLYLCAWIPILGRHHETIAYIDGFAGPGEYEGGEPGSPIIAMEIARGFAGHLKGKMGLLFIEADEDRFDHLQTQIENVEMPANVTAKAKLGKFHEEVRRMIARKRTMPPSFVLIDPFGFSHTPIAVVASLLALPRCEVMITFMFEEINRFLEHQEMPVHFDALFGTGQWRDALVLSGRDRRRFIRNLYEDQLKQNGAQFVHVFEMRNERDRTDYFLFFATNNVKGLQKMKEAMWRVDESGAFTFSDASDPDQAVLFGKKPDFGHLARLIHSAHTGATLTIRSLEEWVVAQTPFHMGHVRRALKLLESDGRLIEVLIPTGGLRRGRSFPDGCLLVFSPPQ